MRSPVLLWGHCTEHEAPVAHVPVRQAPGIPTTGRHVKDRPDRRVAPIRAASDAGRGDSTRRATGGGHATLARTGTYQSHSAGRPGKIRARAVGGTPPGAAAARVRQCVHRAGWGSGLRVGAASVATSQSPVKAFTSTERTESRATTGSQVATPPTPTTHPRAVHPSIPFHPSLSAPSPSTPLLPAASSASSSPPCRRDRDRRSLSRPARGEEYSQVRGHLTCPGSDLPRLNASRLA